MRYHSSSSLKEMFPSPVPSSIFCGGYAGAGCASAVQGGGVIHQQESDWRREEEELAFRVRGQLGLLSGSGLTVRSG